MSLQGCPAPFQVLFQLMESHLPQVLGFLQKLSDMKVIHPDQYLVHQGADLAVYLLPYLRDMFLDAVDPMTGETAEPAKLKRLAAELKCNLYGNASFVKLSVAQASEKCQQFLQALANEFPELEAEQRRLSSLLPDIPALDGTTSTSSTTVLMQEVIANAAGCKNIEEAEDTVVPCPILGGRPRAIYAQSLRPMYERKDQGILQTSSGNIVFMQNLLSVNRYYIQPGKVGGTAWVAGQRVRIPTGCELSLPVAPKSSGTGQNGDWRNLQACPIESETLLEATSAVSGDSEGSAGCGIVPSSTGARKRDLSQSRVGEGSVERYKKKKRFGVDDDIVQEILDLLNSVVVTPPAQIMNTKFWEDNIDLQNLPENDRDVVLAFKRWNRKLAGWKIADFVEFYNDDSRNYLFQDVHCTNNLYYSVEDSLKHVSNFLENSFDDVSAILHTLVEVLDRKSVKKNTIEICAPPSTGKTWFFDMIIDFFINVGHLKNMNKFSQFPFQDCRNRRVILWNEPNCNPEALDTLKTVYGGDRCPAAVKCKDDDVITRTPLIVTTNSFMFPGNDALDARRYLWQFKTWPALKEIGEQKLHPLVLPRLLNKYNVSF